MSPVSIEERSTLSPRGNTCTPRCIYANKQAHTHACSHPHVFVWFAVGQNLWDFVLFVNSWLLYHLKSALPFLEVTRLYNLFSSLCRIDLKVSRRKSIQKQYHSVKRWLRVVMKQWTIQILLFNKNENTTMLNTKFCFGKGMKWALLALRSPIFWRNIVSFHVIVWKALQKKSHQMLMRFPQ